MTISYSAPLKGAISSMAKDKYRTFTVMSPQMEQNHALYRHRAYKAKYQ